MTKDRLAEVQKVTPNLRSSSNSLQISINDFEIDSNTSLEKILEPYSEIRIQLAQMSENLETMRNLSQILNIRDTNEKAINELQGGNLQIGNSLMNKFQIFKANLPAKDDFSMESRIKRTLFYGLHQSYINLWNKNEEFLREYEHGLKNKLKMHSKLLNYNATDEELEALIANQSTKLFVGNILQETEKERRTLRNLLDRFDELKRLEKSIEEVHSLFIRIQNLVMEQGDIVQRIEFNIDQTVLRADKGKIELEKADKYHKKALKKKILLITIGIAILVVLILICFI